MLVVSGTASADFSKELAAGLGCDIAETENYRWPLSTLLPGVLPEFDLPDCYRALEAKNLRQLEPWGARADG